MKKIALEQLPPEVQGLLEDLRHHRVLITRGASPYAVVSDVRDKDEEELELEESPEFWRTIQERRGEQAIVPFEEVMDELAADELRLNSTNAEAPVSRVPAATDGNEQSPA